MFDLCRALRCSFAAERLVGKKDSEKTLTSNELQLPYLYLFCVTKFQDWCLHVYNSRADAFFFFFFYKFIALHLKSRKKISFQ